MGRPVITFHILFLCEMANLRSFHWGVGLFNLQSTKRNNLCQNGLYAHIVIAYSFILIHLKLLIR